MAQDRSDPPTAQTIRHERRITGGSLEEQIKQQKQLIFEMFQRGDNRAAIKKERDRLRFLQRQAEGGGKDAVAESAVQEYLAAAPRPPTQRIEKGTGREAKRRSTAKTLKVPPGQKEADLKQLDAAIEQQKKLIYQLFQKGEDRDTIKSHRDKLRQLEHQRKELGAAVVEAHDRVEALARKRGPRRFLRMMAIGIPFMVLAVVLQGIRTDPLTVIVPWYGYVVVVGLSVALLSLLWTRFHHAATMGVGYPLAMFIVNGTCAATGLLGPPTWSLSLGFITWLLIGLCLAFVDKE